MMRAVASVPPPAPQGTMSWIGRCGYCACAVAAAKNASAATSFLMGSPPIGAGHCKAICLAMDISELLNKLGVPAAAARGGARVVHSPIDGSELARVCDTPLEQARAAIAR